jgi:hypothetical protein
MLLVDYALGNKKGSLLQLPKTYNKHHLIGHIFFVVSFLAVSIAALLPVSVVF